MPITPVSLFSALIRAYLLGFMGGYEFLTAYGTGMIRIATSNRFLLFLFGFHQFPHFPFARVFIPNWWLSVLLSIYAFLADEIIFTMVRIELRITDMALSIHLTTPIQVFLSKVHCIARQSFFFHHWYWQSLLFLLPLASVEH